ncbi:MAG: cysteine desulfurase [Eubacteriaceae bacterium]|nr:cysteine desulfurase [Eubacteriaceae bacterium]
MIYFDNAATTQPLTEVIGAIDDALKNHYANSSSLHKTGKQSKELLDDARNYFSSHYNLKDGNVIFTSCATESNNTVLYSLLKNYIKKNKKYNLVTLKIEHPSVYNTIKYYYEDSGVEIRYIKTDKNGNIDVENYKSLIDENTLFVSLSCVNNEIGTKNDIALLSKIAKQINPKLIFHSDFVQAAGKFALDMDKTDIDAISVSGHKFHAPKGIGVLLCKKNFKIAPLLHGGGQENELRAGTENIAYIIGIKKALELSEPYIADPSDIIKMRQYLISNIQNNLSDVILNSPQDISKASPYIINMAVLGCKGEVMQRMLDEADIAVSTSSACSAKKRVSRVLIDAGMDKSVAESSIRMSISRFNTISECDKVTDEIIKNANRLRKVGHYNK